MKAVNDKIMADGHLHTVVKVGRKWLHVKRDSDGQKSKISIVNLRLHGDTTLYVP